MFKSCHPNWIAGRGAPANVAPRRFGLPQIELDGDWLDEKEELDGAIPPLRTTVTIENPKTIISRNSSPDIPFDQSINPYRGCEHGCIYCYARPTHAWHDLSPGLDFESRLFAKPDAPRLLRAELSRKAYSATPIAFGTNTDPYQPVEGQYRITRACLELLSECNHPVTITTKSDRVLRDLDLIESMAERGLIAVAISVTSLDPQTHRTLEPRAPRPEKRLDAIRLLSNAGVPTHLSVSPIIPAITDHELEAILERGALAGATSASYIPVRLPHEVAPLFREWLNIHCPDRADKVMHQIQALREGRDNDPAFFSRMRGKGIWADMIRTRFQLSCKRLNLNLSRIELRSDLFVKPSDERQLSLL